MKVKKIICSLTNSDQYRILSNKENDTYCVKISRLSPTWFYDLCDMYDFYSQTDIIVQLNIEEDQIQFARSLYGNHQFNEMYLREYESKILVHSTPKENVRNILVDMELKCWNRLSKEKIGWESKPIGALLGDIDDFSNYVMLSDVNFNAEIIVASKQKQKITIDPNQAYHPGARFYLDAEKMARDKVLLRDGVHTKVKDHIPLDRYMIWYATADVLNIEGETTPKNFFEKANQKFFNLFSQYQ